MEENDERIMLGELRKGKGRLKKQRRQIKRNARRENEWKNKNKRNEMHEKQK